MLDEYFLRKQWACIFKVILLLSLEPRQNARGSYCSRSRARLVLLDGTTGLARFDAVWHKATSFVYISDSSESPPTA